MSADERFVIIGASLAGMKAAARLRFDDFAGTITLIGSEKDLPYERPPLSKDLLTGKAERASVFIKDAAWYADNHIDLRLGISATGIDLGGHTVTLEGGERLPYDKLLLATGASPIRLDLDGAELDGIHYLRTLPDSDALRADLQSGDRRVVVIGSGWIGMELAAAARTLGNEVVVLGRDAVPLSKPLGAELGQVFADLHRAHGVDLRSGSAVTAIDGANGHVTGVRLATREVVPADVVIIAVGARPNVDLAQSAGLETDAGVIANEALQTSDPDVFVAGDLASAYHPVIGARVRSEHWHNALSQGKAAARSMLGQTVSFDDIPYFYTDQFDLSMEYSGYASLQKDARTVYRGDVERREFVVFWLTSDNHVVAGMNVNVWDVNDEVQRIIRRGTPVDPATLADPGIPLSSV